LLGRPKLLTPAIRLFILTDAAKAGEPANRAHNFWHTKQKTANNSKQQKYEKENQKNAKVT
jgi:hypothetical protein